MPKLSVIPVCSALPARQSGRCEREYQISLVTPLFGGGAEPGKTDKDFPIRGTSIRGHLRFWWRATKGYRLGARMWQREEEVFGSTEFPSPLDIRVLSQPKVVPVGPTYGERFGPIAYALFSAIENKQQVMKEGGVFRLQLAWANRAELENRRKAQNVRRRADGKPPLPDTVDDIEPDITAAFQAWCAFGGLGARTRRGCGALLCKELAPKNAGDLDRWFKSGALKVDGTVRDWPTMPDLMLVQKVEQTPIDAWKKVIGLLQKFRQGEEVGRNKGGDKSPGRSRWPEPETIRRVTGKRSRQHARLTHIPNDAFPRAEFGLPIVFHFQGNGEPPDTVLYPSNDPSGAPRERMASPLILKPLALANGKAVPLIVRLITPPLEGVVLKEGSKFVGLPSTTVVRDKRLASYSDSPLSASASGSAIEAFLCYVHKNGFCEIKR